MCGIIGFSVSKEIANREMSDVDKDLVLSLENFEFSTNILAHRGPDDSGIFYDATYGIALGHRRLSIIETSSLGHQPMFDREKKVSIVYNGEIYNFKELKFDLERKGYSFKGSSDTEVLLNLYLDLGEDMLSKLNGIFSLAIWDSAKDSLFIARDSLGVKPLYYSSLDGKFIFSSEIKALMCISEEGMKLDHSSLHRYLSFLWCPGEGTPLKEVRKLNPGEALWISQGVIKERYYWYKLPVFRKVKKLTNKTNAIKEVASQLRRAVHNQMVSDVPLGAFLSGGLDSSSVVAFAKEINPNISCFTIDTKSTDPGMTEDLPYAKEVAEFLKVPLDIVSIEPKEMAADLEKMVIQLDEPLADLAPLNCMYISKLARESNIKVLLSGAGGDDIFSGYRRHAALRIDEYLNLLPNRMLSKIEETSGKLNSNIALFRKLAKLFNGSTLDKDRRIINYFLWTQRADLMQLYTDDFKTSLLDEVAENPMIKFLKTLPSDINNLDTMLSLEQRFFLPDHNLTYTDKMSMIEGVEVRVPFLDKELIEFSASIPHNWKQRRLTGKWILKKAMEPYLPKKVIYRPKSGFGVPLRSWMRYELKEILGDLLSVDSVKKRGLFNPESIQRLIKSNDSGKIDASYTLLSLLCIEIWCRHYLDQSSLR